MATLAGGSAAGQAVIIVASPVLTRLYSPGDFGLLAIYAAMISMCGVMASLHYQLAIPIPRTDKAAASVALLAILLTLASAVLLALLSNPLGRPIANVLNAPALIDYFWLVPIGVAFFSLYQVLTYWAIRKRAFGRLARTKLSQALSATAIQIAGATAGPPALLIGQAAGQGVGSVSLGELALKNNHDKFLHLRLRHLAWAARRYIRFPLYSSWGGLFNTAGQSVPPLMFAGFFSMATAGHYMLAHRVLALPMTLVGRAIGDVFFSGAAEARRLGTLPALIRNVHCNLAHIAMPPALVLLVAGPELFSLAFGDSWKVAGIYAAWMAPWIYLAFLTAPLTSLFSVLEKQPQGLVFQVVQLLVRAAAIVIGAWLGSALLAVAFFSLASVLSRLWLLIWIARATAGPSFTLMGGTVQPLPWSLVIVSPLIVVSLSNSSLEPGPWIIAIIAVALAALFRYRRLAVQNK